MGKATNPKTKTKDAGDTPTVEQQGRATFKKQLQPDHKVSPFRRVPIIDSLHRQDILSEREYTALAYYRDQASLAERSPVKSCIDATVGGGNGPGVAIISAVIETGRLEREMGALCDIARAVAVDDISLAQWCIAKHGGRERYNGKGEFVAVVPINEKRHMETARVELKMAARRIMGP